MIKLVLKLESHASPTFTTERIKNTGFHKMSKDLVAQVVWFLLEVIS